MCSVGVKSQSVGESVQSVNSKTSAHLSTAKEPEPKACSILSNSAIEYNITNKQRRAKHIKWSNDFGLGYLNKYCVKKDDSRYTEFDSTYASELPSNLNLTWEENSESSEPINDSRLTVQREVKGMCKNAPSFTVHQSSCGLNTDVVYKLVE